MHLHIKKEEPYVQKVFFVEVYWISYLKNDLLYEHKVDSMRADPTLDAWK